MNRRPFPQNHCLQCAASSHFSRVKCIPRLFVFHPAGRRGGGPAPLALEPGEQFQVAAPRVRPGLAAAARHRGSGARHRDRQPGHAPDRQGPRIRQGAPAACAASRPTGAAGAAARRRPSGARSRPPSTRSRPKSPACSAPASPPTRTSSPASCRTRSASRRCLLDTLRLICYRAETLTATLLAPHLGKPAEVRALVKALFHSDATLRPDPAAGTLTVQLLHMATQAQDDAVAALCRQLNRSATLYPGTSLRLVYEILPPQPPT